MTCREQNWGIYGLTDPLINPWTSRQHVIDIVNELFLDTTRFIEQPSSEVEQPRGRVQAKKQLPELASALFLLYSERLQWLKSSLAASEPGVDREKARQEERFKQIRPELLETLRESFHSVMKFSSFLILLPRSKWFCQLCIPSRRTTP